MICTLWTPLQAERDWKNSYREILLIPLYIFYSLCLQTRSWEGFRCPQTFFPCIRKSWPKTRTIQGGLAAWCYILKQMSSLHRIRRQSYLNKWNFLRQLQLLNVEFKYFFPYQLIFEVISQLILHTLLNFVNNDLLYCAVWHPVINLTKFRNQTLFSVHPANTLNSTLYILTHKSLLINTRKIW